ncbi:MAG: hypothetical protein FJ045_05285 [Crenarchaeota archaeon]|nr:hypothetical protein [Thermoproteota archaeon]
MKILIDDVFVNRNVSMLLFVVVTPIFVYAGNAVFGAAQNYTLAYLGQRVIYSIRVEIYEHLQRLSLGFYER